MKKGKRPEKRKRAAKNSPHDHGIPERQKLMRERLDTLRARVSKEAAQPYLSGDHNRKPASKFSYKLKVPGMIRLLFAVAIFVTELVLFIILSLTLRDLSVGFYLLLQIIAFILVLHITQKHRNSAFTLSWTVLLLSFPPLGLILYLFWGREGRFPRKEAKLKAAQNRLQSWQPDMQKQAEIITCLQLSTASYLQLHYLSRNGFALYQNSSAHYYASGEEQFEQMFKDLEEARHSILIEYFIVAEGQILQQIQDILIRKAKDGVEIRFLMDDFGSVAKAPTHLIRTLRENGVKVQNFNPVNRYISKLYVNYRNHQKVCVIDGQIAWFGGTNLADEYANIYERYGYWKDCAVRVTGEACRGATIGFFLMWELESDHGEETYSPFFPDLSTTRFAPEDGRQHIFVPYWDGPLMEQGNPAEDLYLSMFNTARHELLIITPYFVIDEHMMSDLCRAARSGVQVMLLCPGIPDKKAVNCITRSNYGPLLKAGARVFEYSPGFIHCKTAILDGEAAITGSINLDYRSLFLHYENAIYIYDNPVVQEIRDDFFETLKESREISLEDWRKRPIWLRLLEPLLKIFSPLL